MLWKLYWGSGKQVLLLGRSKGGVDAAAVISLYWSELKGKVAGLALVQGLVFNATPRRADPSILAALLILALSFFLFISSVFSYFLLI
jgi:hypothetical protein